VILRLLLKRILDSAPLPVLRPVRSPSLELGPWRRGVFFEMLRRRLHLKVRIRPSPLYPHIGGVSSANRGHVSCASKGSFGLQSVFMFVCRFRFVSYDLAMVVAMMCRSPLRS
jgi:hypothetical protein